MSQDRADVRWLVTGAGGMLGQDLVALLEERGRPVTAVDRGEVDITDREAVQAAVAGHGVVVNCAAWTAVDDAEAREGEAFEVNATGAQVVAAGCAAAGARLVHVSTDYVFDGDAQEPYPASGLLRPRSAYGRTKAAGEWAVRAGCPDHLLVRTAWLYGAHGPCFPRTVQRLLDERGGMDVVTDQVGQPTWTVDLADLVVRLVDTGARAGTYHGTSAGRASWFDFAGAVAASAGHDRSAVRPTTSASFVRPAPRPAFSVLDHASLLREGVDPIGPWQERWEAAAGSVLGRDVSRR